MNRNQSRSLRLYVGESERIVLCGGICLYAIGLTAVQWATPRSLPQTIVGGRMLAAAVCVALMRLGGFLPPVVLMGFLALIPIGLIRFQSQVLEFLESSSS